MATSIPPQDVDRILTYLDLAPSAELPSSPRAFLTNHIHSLPPPLLASFTIVPPRQRSSVPLIKSRRLTYASRSPLPSILTAESARLRWPLLWERLGGGNIALAPPTADVEEEEEWVKGGFLPGVEGRQHVKRLGGFLRGLQEEREMEDVMAAKRVERRLDDQGEEFDSDTDDEDEAVYRRVPAAGVTEREVREVKEAFEKKVMELFIDGLDTIDYDPIDFTEPPEGDTLATQDDTERYFDDESPSLEGQEQDAGVMNGVKSTVARTIESVSDHVSIDKASARDNRFVSLSLSSETDGMSAQNGQGEYDY